MSQRMTGVAHGSEVGNVVVGYAGVNDAHDFSCLVFLLLAVLAIGISILHTIYLGCLFILSRFTCMCVSIVVWLLRSSP